MRVGETVLKLEIGAGGGREALRKREGGKENKEERRDQNNSQDRAPGAVDGYIIHKY